MLTTLKGKKRITNLFEKGVWVRTKKLGIRVLKCDDECFPENIKIHIGVAVPKKNIGKAVGRNLLKRRMRVAFAKQQHLFLTNENECFLVMLCYFDKKIMSYETIASELKKIAKTSKIF